MMKSMACALAFSASVASLPALGFDGKLASEKSAALTQRELDQAWNHFEAASGAARRGNPREALRRLRQGLITHPAETSAHVMAARLAESEGQFSVAVSHWQAIASLASPASSESDQAAGAIKRLVAKQEVGPTVRCAVFGQVVQAQRSQCDDPTLLESGGADRERVEREADVRRQAAQQVEAERVRADEQLKAAAVLEHKQAEARRLVELQRKAAAAQERVVLEQRARDLLATYRKLRPMAFAAADCPHCPETFPTPKAVEAHSRVPIVDDPVLGPWLKGAHEQLLQHLRQPALQFRMPVPSPAPCAAAEAAIESLVGFNSTFEELPPRYSGENDKLRSGAPGYSYFLIDKRLAWAEGQCQNGALSGLVNVWASAIAVSAIPARLFVSPRVVRLQADFQEGVASHIRTGVAITEGISDDPELLGMLKDTPGAWLGEKRIIFSWRAGAERTKLPRGLMIQRVFEHPQMQQPEHATFVRTALPSGTMCFTGDKPSQTCPF